MPHDLPSPLPAIEQPGAALPDAQRLRHALAALGQGLLQRDEAVHLALLAALAGEHVLLIGPPGTAKSALARRLHRVFGEARYFERLLTRFSTPEELFGPLSLKALEHDRYERLTEGFLPTAGIAFLDEVFKANSAILNALLTLLNERLFDNGTERRAVPLVAVVAASNEVPADEALHAFYDRFLVRVPVAPVDDEAFDALLALQEEEPVALAQPISAAERAAVAARAANLPLADDFVAACGTLRAWLAARKSALSDRRWRQLVGLTRTACATEGRNAVDRFDLWLVPYVAAAAPAEVAALQAWFEDHVLAVPPATLPWLERALQAFEKQLGLEQQRPAEEAGDDGAGKLALARAIGLGEREDRSSAGGMPRIVSEHLEAHLAKRWGARHVQARVAQVEEIEHQVQQARELARQAHAALVHALQARLWVPANMVQRWRARHAVFAELLAACAARLAAVRAGFAALPVDAFDEGPPPRPVALDAEVAGPTPAAPATAGEATASA